MVNGYIYIYYVFLNFNINTRMKVIYTFSIFGGGSKTFDKLISIPDKTVNRIGKVQAINEYLKDNYKVISINHFKRTVSLKANEVLTDDESVVPLEYKKGGKRYTSPKTYRSPKRF